MSERTSLKYIYYALQLLYSSGIFLQKTAQHLSLSNYKKKSRICLELDSKVRAKQKILQKRNKIQYKNS